MTLIDKLFSKADLGLEKVMDLNKRRNDAIISNIANAETPAYRAVDLDFAGELKRAFGDAKTELSRTNPGHFDLEESSSSHLVADHSGQTKADGNNVDIDVQMGRLGATAGKYSAAANILRKKIGMIKMAVRDIR